MCPASQVLMDTFCFDCFFCFRPDETSAKNYFALNIIIAYEFHLTIKNKLYTNETTMIENSIHGSKIVFQGSSMSLKF